MTCNNHHVREVTRLIHHTHCQHSSTLSYRKVTAVERLSSQVEKWKQLLQMCDRGVTWQSPSHHQPLSCCFTSLLLHMFALVLEMTCNVSSYPIWTLSSGFCLGLIQYMLPSGYDLGDVTLWPYFIFLLPIPVRNLMCVRSSLPLTFTSLIYLFPLNHMSTQMYREESEGCLPFGFNSDFSWHVCVSVYYSYTTTTLYY